MLDARSYVLNSNVKAAFVMLVSSHVVIVECYCFAHGIAIIIKENLGCIFLFPVFTRSTAASHVPGAGV